MVMSCGKVSAARSSLVLYINQVPGFNINFGSPGDVNNAPTQAIQARNISSASSHGSQILFYKNFHFS
ncbi:hypothetical protein DsansV1_C47g0242791 [Dioscorea sansibarensis]